MTEAQALVPGAVVELVAERPVAGGRILARHEGQIVFVAGTIPGERVRARVSRVTRQIAWADLTEILEPSPDRREPPGDPACAGSLYAHIRYERQLQLKADLIVDAFRRIGKVPLAAAPTVAPSPEHGYRMRARLHVRGGRAVSFREGTHEPCDMGPTRQLSQEALTAVQAVVDVLAHRQPECEAVVIAENVDATERVAHLEAKDGARLDDVSALVQGVPGVTGITTDVGRRIVTLAGSPTVTDSAASLFHGASPVGDLAAWTRHATSFFQGNRFLTGALVRRVLDLAPGRRAVDLYAGVGLFAVSLAARGAQVTAVEGDRSSGADLEANAAPWRERLLVRHARVEDVVARPLAPAPDVVILDPPRSGASAETVRGVIAWRAPSLVYVSCDPPTLARDAARILAAGYHIEAVEAFDLFPNTPHVEAVVAFGRT